MNKKEIEKLLKGETIKVGKNQIYIDGDEFFIVEKYEYTNNGIDMFSVHDGYKSIELAIEIAKTLS
jgi:hypothetical protein